MDGDLDTMATDETPNVRRRGMAHIVRSTSCCNCSGGIGEVVFDAARRQPSELLVGQVEVKNNRRNESKGKSPLAGPRW